MPEFGDEEIASGEPATGVSSLDPRLYGRSFADVYDAWYADLDDPATLVRAVEQRCRPGALIVEGGSGTGRLATPLHAAGFHVVGVDASAAMATGAPRGPTPVVGDMANLPVGTATADLVLIAYNTLFNLPTRALQQRCLAEAGRVLRRGGVFVVEAFVAPEPLGSRPPAGEDPGGIRPGVSFRSHPVRTTERLAILTGPDPDDPDAIIGSHVELGASVTARPWRLVYRTPGEIDECARAAGLTLRQRSSDWAGRDFTPQSERHVSWYERI